MVVKTGVLHLIDTLEPGGAERVAVNLVNELGHGPYRPFLATTRREGPLAAEVLPEVGRIALERTHTLDLGALRRLVAFLRENRIAILHAHSSSLFIAQLAAMATSHPRVIWHDHYGQQGERPAWLWGPPARRASAVLAVKEDLARWSRERLGVDPRKVFYLPNFVAESSNGVPIPTLPGAPGWRVVCVANFRAQKDHHGLLQAFARVAKEEPRAHLLLAGAEVEPACAEQAREAATTLGDRVSFLGSRRDVAALLQACDVGVLGSASEGFPLTLLEYGKAGLATVATRVGQCAEILDEGEAGILVSPGDPAALSEALLALLRDSIRRRALGERLRRRVGERYAAPAVMQRLAEVYEMVLGRKGA